MTKDNSWRNGVMDGKVSDKKEDIPLDAIKPLAWEEENASGNKGPYALKYVNTTKAAPVAAVQKKDDAANVSNATNATATAQKKDDANATNATNATTAAQKKDDAANATNATNATTAAQKKETPALPTQAEIDAKVEVAAEAAWLKKSLEDAAAKEKYAALKAEVKANMTKDNSWTNGVMDGPVSDKK
jgi:hypothetical protein